MRRMHKRLGKKRESGQAAGCLIIAANSTHLTLRKPNNIWEIKAGWKPQHSSKMDANEHVVNK